MIQRIQTLFLLLILIFSLLFLTGSLYRMTDPAGQEIVISFSGSTGTGSPYGSLADAAFMAFSVLVPAISLAAVFLFKRRKLQVIFTSLAIASDIIVLVILALHLFTGPMKGYGVALPGFRCIIPVINLILLVLALRGVVKDEKLVKSYDRLR